MQSSMPAASPNWSSLSMVKLNPSNADSASNSTFEGGTEAKEKMEAFDIILRTYVDESEESQA